MPVPEIDQTRLLLEQQKFALRTFISDEVPLTNLEVNTFRDEWAYGIVAEFRTHIWSHKLPPETKEAEYLHELPVFNSAWQLWKYNHQYSRWFGWVAKRWPPEKRGIELLRASVSFDMDRRTLFPECNFPAGLGTQYRQVVLSDPVWTWHNE